MVLVLICVQILQLEQEMELVLEKRNVAKSAAKEWQLKWTPAITEYSETLKGKQGTMFKQNQQMFQEQGMFTLLRTVNCMHNIDVKLSVCKHVAVHAINTHKIQSCNKHVLVTIHFADDEQEKVALLQLCTLFNKKCSNAAYIYEECKVKTYIILCIIFW